VRKIGVIVVSALLGGALFGGTYAAAQSLITSKQIANKTIRLVDMHPSAIKALKGNRGPRGPQGIPGVNGANGINGAPGPQGPVGATGATGAAGVNGGFDPNKVHVVDGAQFTVTPGSIGSARVDCPLGERALAGGWTIITGGVGEPFINEVAGGSYFLSVFNHSEFTNATVTPSVVCAAK
jgi:Collagen triple helix repeat (20 copies)